MSTHAQRWTRNSVLVLIGTVAAVILCWPELCAGIHWLDGAISGPSDVASMKTEMASGFGLVNSNLTIVNYRLKKIEDAESSRNPDAFHWDTNSLVFRHN
jgi:hypothetical protein